MQTVDIHITPKQYEDIKTLTMLQAERYAAENILGTGITQGYGFYGIDKIEPDKITIEIGSTCD